MKSLKPAPFILASLITGYPTAGLEEGVNVLLMDTDVVLSEDFKTAILDRTKAENLQDLQSEYIDIFDHGRQVNSLYETEYGRQRAFAKGNELGDISGFYYAFGFELDSSREFKEMLDHVSVELEFYALLLMKQIHLSESKDTEGVEIVEDARKKFITEHLGRFVSAIGYRPGVQDSEFYRMVFGYVADLVDAEAKNLNVVVEHVSWFENQKGTQSDEIQCDTAGTVAKV